MLPFALKFGALLALLLIGLALVLPSVALARPQVIARLSAPDGELLIEAEAHSPNAAGSSHVRMRYRYRGIELTYFDFGQNKPNSAVYPYLLRDEAQIRDLGLNPRTGHWYNPSYPQAGHTLYLPPSQFSAAEVDRLADHIRKNKEQLHDIFKSTPVRGSFALSVVKTTARIPYDGIARLVHADPPLNTVLYGDRLTFVIEQDGRVLLYNSYRGERHPPEIVTWGQMLPPRKGSRKPRLRLRAVTVHEDEPRTFDSGFAKKLFGGRLRKDYEILPW